MAGGVLSLCVVLLFVGVALSQTNSPPNVQGQWGDSACNLIPGSDQTYQIRTYFFSAVNTKTLGGTYELHQQLFHDASCSPTLEDARIIEKGSFTLGDRASLERFWNIDYTVTSRTLQVFSSTFASTVNSYVSCIFPSSVQVNVQQDISSVTCSELNINAISGCPVIYDIARRDVDTLFIGQRFPGHPPAYVPPCITVCRPSQYDPFSLAKAASATPTPAQPVLSPNPTPGNGVVFPIGDVVGPINLVRYSSSDVSSSSSATTLAVSLVLLAIVQVLFL